MPYRSRQQMEAIIRTGASVMLPGGRVATRVEELPTEAALAKLDAAEADRLAKESLANPQLGPALAMLSESLAKSAGEREQAAKDELQARIDGLRAELAAAQANAADPALVAELRAHPPLRPIPPAPPTPEPAHPKAK